MGETQLNLADNHCLHVCFKVSKFKLHFETVCVKYTRDEGAAWLVEYLLSMPDILSLIPSTAQSMVAHNHHHLREVEPGGSGVSGHL